MAELTNNPRLAATIRTCIWLSVLAVSVFPGIDARSQEPTIDRIEYSSLQPGSHSTLAVYGKGLKNVRRLWLPFGVMSPTAGHDQNVDNLVVFEGDVPKDVEPDVYSARVITDQGSSASQLLVVDVLPGVQLAAESEVSTTPQLIPESAFVVGQLNPVKSRFFRIPLQQGQGLSLEVLARRLGSDLDPVLRITDPQGREVGFSDDVPGLQGDAALRFEAPASGEYNIELRDVKYTGGGRHFFHLRIGDFPLKSIDARMHLWQQSEAANDAEPNNNQESASLVSAEAQFITGTLQEPADIDWYRIQATDASPLCVTSSTRDIGSAADLVLQLWSSDGKKLAEADDNGPLDAQLITSLPAAGEYLLLVKELAGRGGPEWTYELQLNRGEGRIELTIPSDRMNVPRGGSLSLAATVKRIHFDGPLVLEPVHLPDALVMMPIFLGPKQSVVPITLTATNTASEDVTTEFGALQFQLTSPGRETPPLVFTRTAPPPTKAKAGERFQSILARSDVFAAIRPAAQFSITPDPAVVTLKRGESSTVALKAVRNNDWKMEIEIALAAPADQLLPGLTVPNIKFENEKSEAILTVTAAADAAVGKCSVFVQGTARKDKETATYPLPPITVEIVE
ncbi:MAG: hypothetical protein KDA91_09880 [Planctomycetaceae bacterium]|nr:hypothetical protein [Planctomycetaceae bacterium]